MKEYSLFNYALYISKDKVRNILLNSKYLDLNDIMYTRRNQPKNKDNQRTNGPLTFNISDTLLIYSVRNGNQQMIDLIINHPTFDKKKSRLNEAVFLTIDNSFQIFKKLIHLIDTDLYKYTYQGKTIFSFIYFRMDKRSLNSNLNNNANNIRIINQQKYISEIINEPAVVLDRDSLNDAFRIIFMNSIENDFNSKNLIELLEYDKKHNNYINVNESLSSLYSTLTGINQKAFSFLLEIGFDPNIPDRHGVYLLQYTLFLDAYSFIHSIIQSNKIDIKIKVPIIPYESYRLNNSYYNNIKFEWEKNSSYKIVVKNYTTYLHLAAKFSNSQILKEFLDKKLIDVNVEDDLGNTPLIDACISKRKDNILQLFKLNNIDYQHCNKEGYDALKIINPALKDDDKVIQDKQQYLKELINYCIPGNEENNNNQIKNRPLSYGRI